MPINPNPNANSNGVENRRASSPKRENDVTASKYPVVTQAVYNAIVRGDGTNENLKIKRLCQARNALGKALLLIDGAMQDYSPLKKEAQPPETWNALRQIHRSTERSYLKFPLDIKNK